ncbi:uncharacterized mitochondrial protein-like protein [Tanacetum coccineum]|uniref:Uncharacterized mitochondrial protein-like protein n=1 Tax=Tanacetum coccineum TaxID=301880 RepID=A0ABQ5H3R8_9ASTR
MMMDLNLQVMMENLQVMMERRMMKIQEKIVNAKIKRRKIKFNSTNNVNTISLTVYAASTNEFNVVGEKTSIELSFDPNMPALEDDSIFDFIRDDKDDGVVADMNNLDTIIKVSPNLTTRIHKDHPLDQKNPKRQIHMHEGSKLDRGYTGRAFTIQATRSLDFRFEDPDFPDIVYKVEKALYGLHQAPRAWSYAAFEKLMHEKFQMSSMGELTFFLGLQVKQKKDGIFISQDKYVAEILKKFGFTEVKTASTPMETQKPLLKDEYV